MAIGEAFAYVIGFIIVYVFAIVTAFYLTTKEGENDCMAEYVKSGEWVSYSYLLPSGSLHVEKASSPLNDNYGESVRLGKNYGCAFTSLPTFGENVMNTAYCVAVYAYN